MTAAYSLIKYEPFKYKDYLYPWWGEMIGWFMALSSMLVIPIYAVYYLITTPGSLKKVFFYSTIQNQAPFAYFIFFIETVPKFGYKRLEKKSSLH